MTDEINNLILNRRERAVSPLRRPSAATKCREIDRKESLAFLWQIISNAKRDCLIRRAYRGTFR